MKIKYTNMLLLLLFTAAQLATAQQVTSTLAPENPTPLKYLTSHFGYLGPVKTAVNRSFDKEGRLTSIKEDQEHTFTYSNNIITVKRYGAMFNYTLNANKQITGWTIPGSKEKGTYLYDKAGNLIEENAVYTDYTEKFTYTYDEQHRVTSKTYWDNGSPNRVDMFTYSGDAENLIVSSEVKGDSSSRVFYYYQNGVMVDYVYDYNGASNMENVKKDAYGNVISYANPTYGDDVTIEIAYY